MTFEPFVVHSFRAPGSDWCKDRDLTACLVARTNSQPKPTLEHGQQWSANGQRGKQFPGGLIFSPA